MHPKEDGRQTSGHDTSVRKLRNYGCDCGEDDTLYFLFFFTELLMLLNEMSSASFDTKEGKSGISTPKLRSFSHVFSFKLQTR